MTAWIAPFEMAAVLLALGGALKAVYPGDTARALATFGLPNRPGLVRAGGIGEAFLGAWALLSGSLAAVLLVAASYTLFAGFVWSARRRKLPIASCGCFGKADTPPSSIHLALNVGAAAVAVAVAIAGGAGVVDVLRAQPLAGVPYSFLLVLGVWLAFVALTELPRALLAAAESRAGA